MGNPGHSVTVHEGLREVWSFTGTLKALCCYLEHLAPCLVEASEIQELEEEAMLVKWPLPNSLVLWASMDLPCSMALCGGRGTRS